MEPVKKLWCGQCCSPHIAYNIGGGGIPAGYSCTSCGFSESEELSISRVEEGKAVKYDSEKIRFDLLPPEAMFALGEVLTIGAQKYGDRNWEKGLAWSRVVGAALRHLFAWISGERKDQETGLSHLKHVLCNITFLVAYEARGIGEDDMSVHK